MARMTRRLLHVLVFGVVAAGGCGTSPPKTPGAIAGRPAGKAASLPLAASPCSFGAIRAVVPAGPKPVAIVAADFDRDGKPDVVVANSTNDTVALLRGKGGGDFEAPVYFPTMRGPTAIVA